MHAATTDDVGPDTNEHLYWRVDRSSRPRTCADIVDVAGPTIVRTRSPEAATSVADQLCRRGLPALHYGVSRGLRGARRDFQRFADGTIPVLVTSGGLADLRFLVSSKARCVVFYDPCDVWIPVSRGRVVTVTLVVPERIPELDEGVVATEPDLGRLETIVEAEPPPEASLARRALRAPTRRLPGAVDGLRSRIRARTGRDEPIA